LIIKGRKSEKGRWAEYPEITDFDLSRPLGEVIGEIAGATSWSPDKALKKLNFGVRNTCQGEFARRDEQSAAVVKKNLGEHLLQLATSGEEDSQEQVAALAERMIDASDEQILALGREVFPDGGSQTEFTRLIGAEKEASE
jgi:hypothetical protein